MSTETSALLGDGTQYENVLFPRAAIHEDAGLLARFLGELRYEDIPNDVLHTAKVITLDTLGCIAAGADTPLGVDILSAYGAGNQSNGCRVPGTSVRLAPSLAAKVNAWLADVLDYEDTASGHPSATVIPAALAMAEHLNASPKQFLAGVVAGYEAGLRVHDATRATEEAYRRFAVYHAWHGIAAGAAAMVVSGGSEEQFRSALGHAAANTSIPLWYVQYGRPAHALKANYGQMALGGVDAALCARQNIIGPFAMLSDAERGFANIVGSDQFDPTQLSAGLQQTWRTNESSLKAFPCCSFLHTTIDAATEIVNAHTINNRDIDKVKIRCFSRITEWFLTGVPSSAIDGQLSIHYAAAMALLGIEPGREWYLPSRMASPEVAELIGKMDVEVDPVAEQAFWSSDQEMSSVTIFMKDGRSFSATVEWPTGHWSKPLSDAALEKKFLGNVRGTSLENHASEIIDKTLSIDRLDSMDELLRLLSTPQG